MATKQLPAVARGRRGPQPAPPEAGNDGGSDGSNGDPIGGAGGAGGGSNQFNGTPGGGGGAGWFGGGGGGGQGCTCDGGGGGGGGSSNAAASVTDSAFSQATGGQTPSVTLTFAAPALTTAPNPTTATLGSGTTLLQDTAVLSGGNNPTGVITFTLAAPGGSVVDTEIVTVNGNGTYSTPVGFSLGPGAAAGTYQWDAGYSGDSSNADVTDNNDPGEQVGVSPASPTLTTTPSPASPTLGPTPTTLNDSATLSGGSAPTGTITFTLVANSAPVDTETVTVNGNGTYTTPTGFTLPTTGTASGTYQWNATYSGDANNNAVADTSNANEQVVVSPANPTVTTTPNPTTATAGSGITLKDSALLSGGAAPTGTITFLLVQAGGTVEDTETVVVNGNGTYTTPIGFTLSSVVPAGAYQWHATYSGDSDNTTVSDGNNPNELVIAGPANTALTTTPNPTTATAGSGTTLNDSAVLSGGAVSTGLITFTLAAPDGLPVDTETVAVNGNGTYTTPTGFTLASTAAAGTYQWNATYSGDAGNNSAVDANSPSEEVVVGAADPTVTISSPSDGALYVVGQNVASSFSCTDGAGGPGISTCLGQGNASSGHQVDTSTAGTHSFTVTATSSDGQSGHSSVSYTVAAAPSATIGSPAPGGVYSVGQSVATTFSCTEGAQGPGIISCADSNGAGRRRRASRHDDRRCTQLHGHRQVRRRRDRERERELHGCPGPVSLDLQPG